jgi:hypothetical protein
MLDIRHQSITSEDGKPVGVILDIDTFQRIETIIEDYGLAHIMGEAEDDEEFGREDAIEFYKSTINGLNND